MSPRLLPPNPVGVVSASNDTQVLPQDGANSSCDCVNDDGENRTSVSDIELGVVGRSWSSLSSKQTSSDSSKNISCGISFKVIPGL